MKRDDRVALLLMHRAAAEALEESLKAEAQREHEEHGTAASWRMAPATVTTNLANDRAEVTDEASFWGYLKARWPGEFITVTIPRNMKWVNLMRHSFATRPVRGQDGRATGAVLDEEGTVVPGLRFERGGRFLSASIKPNEGHARVLLDAARYALRTGEWSPLWAYTDGGDPVIVEAMMEEHPDGPPTSTNGPLSPEPDAG